MFCFTGTWYNTDQMLRMQTTTNKEDSIIRHSTCNPNETQNHSIDIEIKKKNEKDGLIEVNVDPNTCAARFERITDAEEGDNIGGDLCNSELNQIGKDDVDIKTEAFEEIIEVQLDQTMSTTKTEPMNQGNNEHGYGLGNFTLNRNDNSYKKAENKLMESDSDSDTDSHTITTTSTSATPMNRGDGHQLIRYQCELCHKAYVSKSDMAIHRRIHTGERPFR